MTAVTSDSCQVEFDFRFGWCRMRLDVAGISATYRATSVADAFGALAYAVATVATGALTASALWGDEPGGVFVDLSTSGPHHLGLVVAGLDVPGWRTSGSPPWTPLRGAVLTNAIIPREVGLRAFHAGFTSVLGQVSEHGRIEGWGHRFPSAAVAAIETARSGGREDRSAE